LEPGGSRFQLIAPEKTAQSELEVVIEPCNDEGREVPALEAIDKKSVNGRINGA